MSASGSSRQLTLFGKLAKPRVVYSVPANDYEKFVNATVSLTSPSVPLAAAKQQADEEWRVRKKDKLFVDERIRKGSAVLDRQASQAVDSFVTVRPAFQPAQSTHAKEPPATEGAQSTSNRQQAEASASSQDETEKLRAILLRESHSRETGKVVFDFLVSRVELPDTAKKNLFSADVIANVIFTEALASVASCYDTCAMAVDDYKELSTGKRQWGTSKMARLQKSCAALLEDIRQVLTEVASISLPAADQAPGCALSRTSILKKELMKDAVIKCRLLEKSSEDLSRRVRIRVAQMRGKFNPLPKTSMYRILCMHSLDMDWETAVGNIADADSEAFVGPLTARDLRGTAKLLQSQPGLTLSSLLSALGKPETGWAFHHGCALNLLQWFPVLVVMRSFTVVVINLHEAVLDEHLLDDLINVDQQDDKSTVGEEQTGTPTQGAQVQYHAPVPAKGKGGRTPIHVRYPALVDTMATFIGLHGFSAQERRRTDTANTCGVSLQQIRSHLQAEFPALKISRSSVHRLMVAPNKHHRSARLYKGLVNARIPRKQNTASSDDHVDLHYTMTQVNYANELFELFPDECVRISVDDKNKVNVGTLAVSRFFQINKFFPVGDSPNYEDHDFPYSQSKLVPSGYLVMKTKGAAGQSSRCRSRSVSGELCARESRHQQRSRSAPPAGRSSSSASSLDILSPTKCDRHGRQHVKYGRTGDLHVFNRAMKYSKTSPMTHVNDLHYLLSTAKVAGDKKAVLLVSDNGPDWNPKFPQTFIYLGRLWRDLQLDALVQTTYAAGHSRFNMVERAWAPLSWRLLGVTLPITLPGESTPPSRQANLTPEALREKEYAVFNTTMNVLNSYWNGTTYDGYPVYSSSIQCGDEPTPYNDEEEVEASLKAGVKEHETSHRLKVFREELQFLYKHGVVRCNAIEFYRCCSVTCSHCKMVLPRATKLLAAIQKLGGRLPTPEPLPFLPGHYKSLLQVMGPLRPSAPLSIDHGIPSLTSVDVCPRGCQVV